MTGGNVETVSSSYIATTSAGSVTYPVSIERLGLSVDVIASVNDPFVVFAEDIGPSGAPS